MSRNRNTLTAAAETARRGGGENGMTVPEGLMISIGALSRASGIPVETLRTWERRYGFPLPVRKPSGHRLYPSEGIGRLRHIAVALARGHRIGDVIRAPEDELERLLEATPPVPSRIGRRAGRTDEAAREEVPAAAAPDPPTEIERTLQAVRSFDGEGLTRQLFSSWARFGPVSFLSHYVAPMLAAVGREWELGRLQIRHEHFLTQRLSDVLRTARMPLEEYAHGPRAIWATLPGEEHSLGLEMAALLFAHAGWRSIYLGTQVPEEEIAAATSQRGTGAVGVSVSRHADAAATRQRLQRLRSLLPASTPLLAGGEGAPALPGVERFRDFGSLHAWAAGVAALAAPVTIRRARSRRAPGSPQGR